MFGRLETGELAKVAIGPAGVKAGLWLVLAAALSEDDGDDPRDPGVHAERVAGRWVLTGVKTAVLGGVRADLLLVPAGTPQGTLVFVAGPADDGSRSPTGTARGGWCWTRSRWPTTGSWAAPGWAAQSWTAQSWTAQSWAAQSWATGRRRERR